MEEVEYKILSGKADFNIPLLYHFFFYLTYILPARGWGFYLWPYIILGNKIILDLEARLGLKKDKPIIIKYSEIKSVKLSGKYTIILSFKKYSKIIKFNSPEANEIMDIIKKKLFK
ncbi:MAG: hypothetical protein V1740_05745 [Candidatus Woesearchaeota archaeon]